MKKAWLLLISLISLNLTAQTVTEWQDSLAIADTDSAKISIYGKIALKYARSNPDSAFLFGYEGLSFSLTTDVKAGQASMHNILGNVHFFQSSYDSALFYYSQTLGIANEIRDSLRIGAMLNNIGTVFIYKTEYDTAIEMLHQAFSIREVIDDPKITSSVNNIGLAYQRLEDWDRALEYYLQAAELKRRYNQRQSLSNTLNNIGIVLRNQGKITDAIPYYHESLEIAIEFNDRRKEANAHNNLAAAYHVSPDLKDLAQDHYLKSIAIKDDMGDQAGLANSYSNYADWLGDMGRIEEALGFIEKSEVLNEKIGKNLYSAKIGLLKSNVLLKLGRKDEAYVTLRETYDLRVDELTEDRNDQIAEWEARFETANKEAEIEKLSLKNQLNESNLAKAKNRQLAIGVGAGLSVVTLLIIVFVQIKKRRLENELRELQIDALSKRLSDLNISHGKFDLNFESLNSLIQTPISEREFEVLGLSVKGRTNAEISDELFISVSTVKFHLRNTYAKLGVSNRKEALKYVSEVK